MSRAAARAPRAPKSIEEAVKVTEMTAEDQDVLEGRDEFPDEDRPGMRIPSPNDIRALKSGDAAPNAKDAEEGAGEDEFEADVPDDAVQMPAHVVLPPGVVLPKGYQVWFVRFHANLTNTPTKGDRWCVLWNLVEADEKFALKRTMGDHVRTLSECAKQTVRITGFVTDPPTPGNRVNWGLGHHALSEFWDGIGGAYRQQLMNMYVKNHTLGAEQAADFFSKCVVVLTADG